jgi:hypothetical protein
MLGATLVWVVQVVQVVEVEVEVWAAVVEVELVMGVVKVKELKNWIEVDDYEGLYTNNGKQRY